MGGVAPCIIVERDPVELALHPSAYLVCGDAEVLGAEGHIVLDDGRDDLVIGVLEDEADLAPGTPVRIEIDLSLGEAALPHKLDFPLVGRKKATEHACQGRLARPIGA